MEGAYLMLFGNKLLREKIVADAAAFMEAQNGRIIYGAVCGSISKGFQSPASDYDTRFLYILPDFPDRIIEPKITAEPEIIKRFYTDGISVPYEWIPCWELTSFFQYLIEPYIEGKFSCGLYNTVGWTLMSPYARDPYGLQQKIMPLVNSIFEKKYALGYYAEYLENFLKERAAGFFPKDLVYILYTAAQISWVIKNNSFPPVNGKTLLFTSAGEDITAEVGNIWSRAENGLNERLSLSAGADNFVSDMLEKAKAVTEFSVPKQEKIRTVNKIYELIYYSVFSERKVNNVSDFELKGRSSSAGKWKILLSSEKEEVLYENGVYEIDAKSPSDCRRLRLKLCGGRSGVIVKRITLSSDRLFRIITVNGQESFALGADEEVFSDDVSAWLCYSRFRIKIELSENKNEKSPGVIRAIEEWVYEAAGAPSEQRFL